MRNKLKLIAGIPYTIVGLAMLASGIWWLSPFYIPWGIAITALGITLIITSKKRGEAPFQTTPEKKEDIIGDAINET